MTPRFPTETPKNEPEKMPLPTLQKPPMTEVSETPLATPWKSRTSEGVSAVPKPVLKGIETFLILGHDRSCCAEWCRSTQARLKGH